MRTEAKINWQWLKTRQGMVFLKQLNKRMKSKNIPFADDIGCPFPFADCENKCNPAFYMEWEWNCPCFTFKAPFELAVILSDYYDMVKDEKI